MQDGRFRLSPRLCLLKGCERNFQPNHHRCRYCSEDCVVAARKWRRWLADQKYRASKQGKQARQDQSIRYREKCKQELIAMKEPEQAAPIPSVGDTKAAAGKKSCCHRPGCYEQFLPAPQTPHQKYCGPECYQAMRRVLIREKRWRDKLKADKLKHSEPAPSTAPKRQFE
jgi:hypothetical protein